MVEGGVWLWSKVDDGCGGRWRVVVVEGRDDCGGRWSIVVVEGDGCGRWKVAGSCDGRWLWWKVDYFKNTTRYEPLIYKFSPPYF